MARTRQSWGSFRTELYRVLREDEDENPYWEPSLLLQLLNDERDKLDTHLGELYEGYNVLSVTTDIESGQAHYMIPEDCSRILKVARLFDSGAEIPLDRLERWSEPTLAPGGSATGTDLPTYRVEDRWIVLEPVPGTDVTDGLKLYYERGLDKVDADEDEVTLPSWPYITESYLKYAVAVAAFEIEGAQGPESVGYYTSLIRKKDDLLEQIERYAETRSFGRTYVTPYHQGD